MTMLIAALSKRRASCGLWMFCRHLCRCVSSIPADVHRFYSPDFVLMSESALMITNWRCPACGVAQLHACIQIMLIACVVWLS